MEGEMANYLVLSENEFAYLKRVTEATEQTRFTVHPLDIVRARKLCEKWLLTMSGPHVRVTPLGRAAAAGQVLSEEDGTVTIRMSAPHKPD